MRLLLDTDAFCKLSVGGVLRDSVLLLGSDLLDCGRLPALPYMLRKGRLRSLYGPAACEAMLPVAERMPIAPQPSHSTWLDKLTPVPAIDPGEAQIFAAAADTRLVIVSGDKRALRALRKIDGYPEALAGRIVVLEAVLLALCDHLGSEIVRMRMQPLVNSDNVVKVCFSTSTADPRVGLLSYYSSLVTELVPLILWKPERGGET